MQQKRAPSSSPVVSASEALALVGVLVAGVLVLGALVFVNVSV